MYAEADTDFGGKGAKEFSPLHANIFQIDNLP